MDMIAAAVLLLFVLVGARQGLVRALAGLVIVIVALLGAAMISATFTEPLAHLAAPVVERYVEDKVADAVTDHTGALDVQRQDTDLEELLDILGIDADARRSIGTRAEETMRQTGATVLSAVVESLARSVIYGVLFLVSFIALSLLLHVLAKAMDLLTRLPGLHTLNALGGAATGFVKGALALFLAIWVLRRLGVSFETAEVAQTYILRFFAAHTPLSALSLLQ